MTFENITAMGQVLTRSGYLFLIKHVLNNHYAVVHPKYRIDGENIVRISNPLDPLRNNNISMYDAIPFGSRDYLIYHNTVEKYYPCFDMACLLEEGTDESVGIRTIAKDLISKMGMYIDKAIIGITGSLATGNAIDDYSDIDLVIPCKHFAELLHSTFWSTEGLVLRSHQQWKDFYQKYSVLSLLSADEFADDAVRKKQQFIYMGVPVSIFIISNEDPFLRLMDSCVNSGTKDIVQMKGEVLVEHGGILPGYAVFLAEERAHIVVNFHRSYQGSLRNNRTYVFQGYSNKSKDLLWIEYDKHCAIWIR